MKRRIALVVVLLIWYTAIFFGGVAYGRRSRQADVDFWRNVKWAECPHRMLWPNPVMYVKGQR